MGNRTVEERVVIGDSNARTGKEDEIIRNEDDGENERRKSKDKDINKEIRILIRALEEEEWGIMNGCTSGDEDKVYTSWEGEEKR